MKELFVEYTSFCHLIVGYCVPTMEAIKRALGLVKTPTQLVDRMHFEFRVMDGEEETDKPRKVI